jgi:hypothetical protein
MKKVSVVFFYVLVFSVSVFANYAENTRQGILAYKSGNYLEAARYFKAAYQERPGDKLEKYYLLAVKKYKEQSTLNSQTITATQEEQKQWMQWVLICTDTILITSSIILYIDMRKAVDNYEERYDLLDNTNYENFNILNSVRDEAQIKQNTFGTVAVIAGAVTAYTLVDFFLLKLVFPKELSLNYDLHKQEIKLAFKKEF